MTTALEGFDIVLRLACLTECRTDAEQRALLATAYRVDTDINRCMTNNRTMWASLNRAPWMYRLKPLSRMVELVEQTRVLEDGDKVVQLPPKQRESLAKRFKEWESMPVANSVVG